METVHAGDGRQKIVLLQGFTDVEHRILRRIKTCQQLGNNNEDFRITGSLKSCNKLAIVFLFMFMSLHHLRSEITNKILGILIHLLVALAVVWR